MHPPTKKRFRIVQIDVTRRCDLACSNCTRALEQHTRPDMTPEQFEQAVVACAPWVIRESGVLSLFGGNPCASPSFERYCEILARHVPIQHRGLWTNNLLNKGEIAANYYCPKRSTFNFNAHCSSSAVARFKRYFPGVPVFGADRPSKHATIFAAPVDFGISEAGAMQAAENCHYDREWSAIVVQEAPDWSRLGGYSCEIASTHARVAGKALGVEVVDGWLDLLEEFTPQYKWACTRCSGALNLKGQEDHLGRDEYSPMHAEAFQAGTRNKARLVQLNEIHPGQSIPIHYT